MEFFKKKTSFYIIGHLMEINMEIWPLIEYKKFINLKVQKPYFHIFLYLNLLTREISLEKKKFFDSDCFAFVVRLPHPHGLNIQKL
jgi:hypothetical protein